MADRYIVLRYKNKRGTHFSLNGNLVTCTHGGWSGYFCPETLSVYYDKALTRLISGYDSIEYVADAEYQDSDLYLQAPIFNIGDL